jgi:hypothetical protein
MVLRYSAKKNWKTDSKPLRRLGEGEHSFTAIFMADTVHECDSNRTLPKQYIFTAIELIPQKLTSRSTNKGSF